MMTVQPVNDCRSYPTFVPAIQARRLNASLHVLQVNMVSATFTAKETETATTLVEFFRTLPLDKKPLFQGNLVERANQITNWMKTSIEVSQCKKLELAHLGLKKLPPEIGLFHSLVLLNLDHNNLDSLPTEIGQLKNLRKFHLSSNQIQMLPKEIGQLENLKGLYLSFNRLRNVPIEMRQLTNLRWLYLARNQLKTLPPEIGELRQLTHLSLPNNQLESLPPEMGKLTNLMHLAISANRLQSLPEELVNLKNLIALEFEKNPLHHPLPQWMTQMLKNIHVHSNSFIAPYHIPTALGKPTAMPPLIARATHTTASIFGPQLSSLLKNLGAAPFDVDINFSDVDAEELTKEVQKSIVAIRQKGHRQSIAQELLSTLPNSLTQKIAKMVKENIERAQGLALPGGHIIEAEFYDDDQPLVSPQDYRRSIAEFALVDAAYKSKKPILGTCRGAQIVNVFFGGTLKDTEEQEIGWQKIQFIESSRKEQLETLVQTNEFITHSFHEQSCDKIAAGLEVVAHHAGIPKLLVSRDGLIVAIQVHPEKSLNQKYTNAIRIYELFFQAMLTPSAKTQKLQFESTVEPQSLL